MPTPLPISGYVLAGGRSSRMGRNKALIPLAGKPLIEHAVTKLRRICADVHILSNDIALVAFAPIVPDLHSSCGPIGGIEAALTHTSCDWNLFLPVDMPLLPTALLAHWVCDAIDVSSPSVMRPGIRIFNEGDRPQPGLCLVHKAVASLITRAILREEFALISVFEEVGREVGHSIASSPLTPFHSAEPLQSDVSWQQLTMSQLSACHLWFLNLNTKEDLALAQANIAALDT